MRVNTSERHQCYDHKQRDEIRVAVVSCALIYIKKVNEPSDARTFAPKQDPGSSSTHFWC